MMMTMKESTPVLQCGDVWWAQFDEPRPVVLLAKVAPGTFQGMQIVEPVTIDITGFGLEVALGAADGLSVDGVVRVAFPLPGITPCTWRATLTEKDVLERAGTVSAEKLRQIGHALDLGGITMGGITMGG